ncbi:MAG: filamentous hemagglutinin N-terminal domain-containing protein [Xenococcaceae cyanobacterium MO_167.B52]|nr:filamentous hemagglutinin N-terminal domain-containing protein [Xenococcaceae cyanobacterium MO_167.B52]
MKSPIFSDRNYLGLEQSTGKSTYIAALSVAFFLSIGIGTTVSAQIVPDNTLPNNSVTLPNGNVIQITGGTTAGTNLFHSFEEFSVFTGDTAWFNNALTIDNIVTRVTGGSISTIDGLIQANGSANLFLINPNGIIFGENAALDIGGSFLGSTADSLKFSDGSEFSAVNPEGNPLLTVSIPIGLQYGTNNGDIVVQGSGNQIQFNPNFTINKDARPTGLEVDTSQTLALVGGNVFVDGGNLTAESGRVELGSVTDNSLVKLISSSSGWRLDYSEVSNFQDIYLALASSVDVSGNGSGDVNLQGREVIIIDGSAILVDTLGDIDGGKLEVNASELLVVAGTATELPFISLLYTNVAPGATGNGGDIELNGGDIIVAGGAQILTTTYGRGNTGNIRVQADDVELISGSPILGSSGIFTLVFGSGNGGAIDIQANNIFVLDGGQAATISFADGRGGNLNLKANNIELTGTSQGGFPSALFAGIQPGATGDGGKLAIEAKSLLVSDGAQVGVSTFGEGNGGVLEIRADDIQLTGTSPGDSSSGLFANVEPGATGNGGLIDIKTQNLTILEGAQITTSTFGSGQAGSVQVQANEIRLAGTSPSGNQPSGLFSTVAPQAEGNGGNLNINTGSLQIIDGGQIAVGTRGVGNGGELNITANEVELIGGSELAASGIFGNAIVDTGDGGNIRITTNSLNIQDGATISASNFSSRRNIPPGKGKAGNILVKANSLQLDRTDSEIPSSITASTNAGGGGEITLNVAEGIILNNDSQITAETLGIGDGGSINITAKNLNLNSGGQISTNSDGIGNAGNINIAAAEEINTNRGKITATSTQSGGGNINLATDFLWLKNNSLISTSVLDSTGGGGNLTINSKYIIAQDNSDLRANAVLGEGGNIDITTEVILLSLDSEIDASSEFGLDGAVEIRSPESDQQIGVVQLQNQTTESTELITANCALEQQNVMVVTGKGGLSENPSQYLRSQSVWEDLRDFEQPTPSLASNKIIEAQQWIVNDRGNVELLSQLPFNQCKK